jgi:hypothetical protein
MNRILKRPMFRMGGSSGTGITSGLDRQNYFQGDKVESDAQKIFDLEQKMREANQIERLRGAPGSVPSFLTNFGLNLLAQPGGKNIFQTAAKAAQQPFNQFQQARLLEQERGRKRRDDAISTSIASAVDLERERLKAAGEIGGGDEFKFQAQIKAITQYTNRNDTLTSENTKLRTEKQELLNQRGPNVDEAAIRNRVMEIDKALEKNNKEISLNNRLLRQIEGEDPLRVPEATAILEEYGIDSPQYKEFKEGRAEGGRAGYQIGGNVSEEVMETADDTGTVQDLTFTELRARLPQSIDNTVVQLLANSKQALLEFANIRDQQDVDQFNQQYGVNLTIPQEG